MKNLFLILSLVFLVSCGSDDESNTNNGDDGMANGTIQIQVTNQGNSSYIFNGNGLSNSVNPALTLQRGMTYTFSVNAQGHPFFIKTEQSTGAVNAYNNGVTNNGTQSGTITFAVPSNAPDLLYYNCQFHTPMANVINIID